MLKIVALLALVGLISAQYNLQPVSNGTFLPGGSTVTGSLIPQSSSTLYNANFYYTYVPENATFVRFNFTFTSTTSTCYYADTFISTYGQPCSDDVWSSSYFSCANGDESYNDDADTTTFTPSYRNDLANYVVGSNWYVSLTKYTSSDLALTCPYTLSFDWGECSGANAISVQTASSTFACTTYSVANNTGSYAISSTTAPFVVYKYNIATPTVASVTFTVNATTSSLDLYGANGFAAGSYTYNHCSQTSYSTSGTNWYNYVLTCMTPNQGAFYFTIDSDASVAWTASVTFAIQDCGNAGMGGVGCNYTVSPLNFTAIVAGLNFTIPYSDDYSYVTYYVDVAATGTIAYPDVVLRLNSPQSAYVIVKRGGFPWYDAYEGYEDSFFYNSISTTATYVGFNSYDWAVAGRYYLGFACYTTTGCNIGVNLNNTLVLTTGGGSGGLTGSATGSATGSVVTGSATGSVTGNVGSSSPASVILAPIAAVFIAMLAMF